MARPVDFEGRTHVYTHGDCYDLPVAIQAVKLGDTDTKEVISAWQLSPEELANMRANGGIVFLRVVGGQPPVEVTGINPITG